MLVTTAEELEGLRRIGGVIAAALAELAAAAGPGMTTADLDARAARFLTARGARSGPILTYGYPGFICISVDDQVVHGIPGPRPLAPGELVTFDIAAELDGFHADAATTVSIGPPSPTAERLLSATRAALTAGIRAARAGSRVGAIGQAVQRVAEARGFSVFAELTGHGIGRAMHEDPTIWNVSIDDPEADRRLEPGMVFTVEPMLGAGRDRLEQDGDGWTMRTRDGSLSAHEEHTIMVTDGEPIILTAG